MKRTWCIAKFDAMFVARMEELLALYAEPRDPEMRVICFDERPCILIGETVAPLPMMTGKVAKGIMPIKRMAPVPCSQPLSH